MKKLGLLFAVQLLAVCSAVGQETGPYEDCLLYTSMHCIECFYATLERRRADRPASWLGIPDPEALPGLFSYLGVSDVKELDVYKRQGPCRSSR